jgi:formamidopyrimidine-DNA glycosylase
MICSVALRRYHRHFIPVPELPDLTIYLEAIERHAGNSALTDLQIVNPFVLRSVAPAAAEFHGKHLRTMRRIGKRLVFGFDDDLFAVIHLMIAGRFKWHTKPPKLNRRLSVAAFVFETGTLVLTEAGTQKRASLHLVRGDASLNEFDRGGLEPFAITAEEFTARLKSENHTVKRSLADPRLFAGIGNAYSDEILHHARMSPTVLTAKMPDADAARLFASVQSVLTTWTDRLRAETGAGFPEKVTAFRPEMAVHGRYGRPCPVCQTPVQRIRYASNETNYCARCQTGGRLLADRGLSRLLKQDWPRSIDELV